MMYLKKFHFLTFDGFLHCHLRGEQFQKELSDQGGLWCMRWGAALTDTCSMPISPPYLWKLRASHIWIVTKSLIWLCILVSEQPALIFSAQGDLKLNPYCSFFIISHTACVRSVICSTNLLNRLKHSNFLFRLCKILGLVPPEGKLSTYMTIMKISLKLCYMCFPLHVFFRFT